MTTGEGRRGPLAMIMSPVAVMSVLVPVLTALVLVLFAALVLCVMIVPVVMMFRSLSRKDLAMEQGVACRERQRADAPADRPLSLALRHRTPRRIFQRIFSMSSNSSLPSL